MSAVPNQVAKVIRMIRALPYSDMMVVTSELRDRIADLTQQRIEANVLAEILCRLQENKVPLSEATAEEEKVLRQIFKVKRTITVQRHGNGWSIDIPTVPGGQVVTTELRGAFPMMLDQIITLNVLMK